LEDGRKRTKRKVKGRGGGKEKALRRVKGENLLDLRPKRTRKWRRGEKVTIVVPKARSMLGKHFCDAFGLKPTYTINLDEYGSAIWRMCDGTTTVREIGVRLKERFGDKVEPLYDRLGAFIQVLKNEDLIMFLKE
jgi:hypothetical protein